ncbi:MAG: outer membrane protein assembly factor BamE [Proteobacteria bacterium]|nr:outer membrane protein assembly factor BamE [Pseudomonadota bacterium]
MSDRAAKEKTSAAKGAQRRVPGRRGLVAGLALGLLVAACSPIMRYHGYAPSDEDLAQIQVGRDTRETVAQAIGQPGMGGVMEGSGWYYVQSDWRERGWRAPEEVDRQVVAISFDQSDRVSNIERFGLADGQVVALSRRVTDAGPRPSVMSQVMSALGQFTSLGS